MSKRAGATRGTRPSGRQRRRVALALEPMLASATDQPPEGKGWMFEPKYDGIRILAFAEGGEVALITRNGLSRNTQFPEITKAIATVARGARAPIVLDGEIVALENGVPARFQALQGRYHRTREVAKHQETSPSALIAFDVLLAQGKTLVDKSWSERRVVLESLLRSNKDSALQLSDVSADSAALLEEAERHGWEGLMAKRVTAPYRPGVRSKDWLKLKLERRQEFVVGGYTEPRNSRSHLGALLIGYYVGKDLVYGGHVGAGFSRATLGDMALRLKPLRRKTTPFVVAPKTNEQATWVKPRVVVEVRFNEWTDEGRLRQPIFLGVRDDKEARDVRREPDAKLRKKATARARRSTQRAADG